MDFFEREARAQKQTRLLVCLFGLAVVAVLLLACLVLGTLIQFLVKPLLHAPSLFNFFNNFPADLHPEKDVPRGSFLVQLWDFQLFGGIAVATLMAIVAGCFYKFRTLAAGGTVVAELLGGRRIEADTTGAEEQRLRHVVEEMAVAAGLPVPEIYLLDRERGINSFAAGLRRDDVALGVTLGALKLLTRDELQGMVAHEFSHILNGDTRLNMKLMALAHGLFWPTLLGRMLVRGSTETPAMDESIFSEEDSPTYLPTAPLGVLFLLLGTVSLPFVRLLKSAIFREREWLADAEAVQFTRNPAGVAGALKKTGGLYKAGRLDSPYAETASHLYFVNSTFDPWFPFLATHPPLAKRILPLEPAFDGTFAHLSALAAQTAADAQELAYEKLYQESLRREREQMKNDGSLQ
jgi:Zn-dependent protease with chaperone function